MAVDIRTGGKNAVLTDPPVDYSGVLSHMVGLGEWRRAAETEGYDENHFSTKVLPASVRAFERRLMSRLVPVRFVPLYMDLSDPLIASSPYNYMRVAPSTLRRDATPGYFSFYAPAKPILAIHSMRIVVNPRQPVYEIPIEWVVFDRESGYVSLQPATPASQPASLGFGNIALALAMGTMDYMPQGIDLVFDCGLPVGWQEGFEYADLQRALEQYTAKKMLDDLCELFDPGRQSVSGTAFGASTTINYERFVRLRGELTALTDAWILEYRQNNIGIEIGMI